MPSCSALLIIVNLLPNGYNTSLSIIERCTILGGSFRNGVIDFDGEERKAEVHWFQEETVGKVKFKVKRWIDED